MHFFSSAKVVLAIIACIQSAVSIPLTEAEAAPELVERSPDPCAAAMLDSFSPALAEEPVANELEARTSCAQSNLCSTGIPYCCSTTGGGHNCVQATVNCAQTVICCNNNFGICIGAIDFTLNLNITVVK